jgi:predicted MFS family arabinose efflux permease
MQFFKNKKSALCIFTCFMACVCLLYFGPILTPALTKMGMSDATAGYGVATCWAVYAVACPFAGKACEYMNRRTVVFWSIFICAVGLFFVGPS